MAKQQKAGADLIAGRQVFEMAAEATRAADAAAGDDWSKAAWPLVTDAREKRKRHDDAKAALSALEDEVRSTAYRLSQAQARVRKLATPKYRAIIIRAAEETIAALEPVFAADSVMVAVQEAAREDLGSVLISNLSLRTRLQGWRQFVTQELL